MFAVSVQYVSTVTFTRVVSLAVDTSMFAPMIIIYTLISCCKRKKQKQKPFDIFVKKLSFKNTVINSVFLWQEFGRE